MLGPILSARGTSARTRVTSQRARGALALALLAAALALVLRVASGARLARADLVFNNGAEIASLDPALVTGIPEGRVLGALLEGLVARDARTLAPVPAVAERFEVSADGLVHTFWLRADARWTSGAPLSADDFVFSFQRLLDARTGSRHAALLYPVVGARAFHRTLDERGAPRLDFDATVAIHALDARTLAIELAAPTPWFLDVLAYHALFPVNRASLEAARARFPDTWQREWLRPERIVTNGPFRVLERRLNDRIRLVKSESYWDADEVALRTIDVLALERYTTMLNLYESGEIDALERVPLGLVPRLRGREDFEPAPYLASYFYRVNVTRPPLDDARVRRALALAIDRRAICERVMKGGQRPLFGLVPPGFSDYAYPELEHGTSFAADCAQAARLFAEAGFGPGGARFPRLEIHYHTAEAHRDVAEVVADGWRRVLGLDVGLASQEWKVYLDTQRSLDYQISRSSWIADYPDPGTFLDVFAARGENNRTGFADARYDALLAAAARELDRERRLALLAQAEARLLDELPILPIFAFVSQNLVAPRLGGFFSNALDEHPLKNLYWMDDDELARVRAQLAPERERVPARGPAAGLYSPAELRRRASGL